MNEHTKGPWRLDQNGEGEWPEVYKGDYRRINAGQGYHPDGFDLTGFMSEADARLITAAPDLLEAVEDVISERTLHGDIVDAMRHVRSALAKATGGVWHTNRDHDFETWWHYEGSEILPFDDDDMSEHAKRIASIAWENGKYLVEQKRKV